MRASEKRNEISRLYLRKYSHLLDNTEEKNPASDFGTPLDLAQHEGHTEVVRLIQNAID